METIVYITRVRNVLKTLEFLEANFKALKVLEIGFWSLKVLDFLLNNVKK